LVYTEHNSYKKTRKKSEIFFATYSMRLCHAKQSIIEPGGYAAHITGTLIGVRNNKHYPPHSSPTSWQQQSHKTQAGVGVKVDGGGRKQKRE
jgi:hypothetical protein